MTNEIDKAFEDWAQSEFGEAWEIAKAKPYQYRDAFRAGAESRDKDLIGFRAYCCEDAKKLFDTFFPDIYEKAFGDKEGC